MITSRGKKAAVYKRPAFAILPVPKVNILINILLAVYVLVCAADASGHSHAAAEKRGLGRGVRRRCDGEYFRRANDKRPDQGDGLAGRPILFLTFALSILYAHRSMASSNLRRELEKTQPAANTLPLPKPQPSSAVGPPGTVTNPTPATTGVAPSPKPADLAVGAVPPAAAASPVATPVTSPARPAPTP